jgi:hypothetical protein
MGRDEPAAVPRGFLRSVAGGVPSPAQGVKIARLRMADRHGHVFINAQAFTVNP